MAQGPILDGGCYLMILLSYVMLGGITACRRMVDPSTAVGIGKRSFVLFSERDRKRFGKQVFNKQTVK